MDKKLVNNRFGLPRRLVAAVILLIMMAASLSPAAAAGPQTNCFISPGACGYPDPAYHNVGVTDCSALPNFSFSSLPPGTYWSGTGNTLEIVSNNVTLSNFNMGDATIYVSDVNNFTLNNVCIRANGNADQGSMAVNISGLSDGTTIENSNISGINDTTEALGMAVLNNGSNTLIRSNYVYNVGSGAPGSGGGSSTVEDNYE
ncbi:MAG TPA: hypothetical protein VN554_01935, partial [Verrucomicrobiae bacterium]|nr:hypothetical protein [Verrucomicrobiae bacterium]